MQDTCVVLYSGGCDSTLAAVLAAQKYEKVRLLTYDRLGFVKTRKNIEEACERLKDVFDGDKFDLEIIKVNDLFRRIQYDRYPYYLRKYGSICMSICGLCKLSMHWKTIVYCIENSIKHVCDGAVEEMSVFPAQNKRIALDDIIMLYEDFDIHYFNPVFNTGKKVESTLYEMGVVPSPQHKLGKADRQVVCWQQFLFAKFVGYYLSEHSYEQYVENLHSFYTEKIEDVRMNIRDTLVGQA